MNKKIIKLALNLILSLLILIISFILFLSINSKLHNTPPIIFGKSYIKLASNSMNASGFKSGELIVTKLINPNQLKIGDTIAFYYNVNKTPSNLKEVETSANGINYSFFKKLGIGCQYFEEAGAKHSIVFHKIVDIKIDTNGELWFQTWGTSNYSASGTPDIDANWTNQKYVIGIYEHKSLLNKLGTSLNNPFYTYLAIASILIFILTFNLIVNLNKYAYISKLKKRQILILDKRLKPQLFKHLTISEKADIISSIRPNELLEFKNKVFNSKFI